MDVSRVCSSSCPLLKASMSTNDMFFLSVGMARLSLLKLYWTSIPTYAKVSLVNKTVVRLEVPYPGP